MNTKYFSIDSNKTLTEIYLKSQWRKIVMDVHPDKGGSHETYLDAQKEYDSLLKLCGSLFNGFNDTVENYGSFDDFLSHISPSVRECFLKVSEIPDITIEIAGQWVWIELTREQVAQREALKQIVVNGVSFRFSSKKSMWYWAGCKSYGFKSYDMDEIRTLYSSKKYTTKDRERIAA